MPTKTKTAAVRYVDDKGTPTPRSSQMILKYVLHKYGKTQGELARAIGLTPSYVSRVLQGTRNLTLAHIEVLSDFLKVPMAVLVWRGLEPNSSRKTSLDREMERLLEQMYPGWQDGEDSDPKN